GRASKGDSQVVAAPGPCILRGVIAPSKSGRKRPDERAPQDDGSCIDAAAITPPAFSAFHRNGPGTFDYSVRRGCAACYGARDRFARSMTAEEAVETWVMNVSTSGPVMGEMSICVLRAS